MAPRHATVTLKTRARKTASKAQLDFLRGGGDMGERIRAKDWSGTPLGPPDTWPQSLRSAVSFLLPSKWQIVLFWGPDLVTIYNDAYRPVFGAKHPDALGLPAREAWSEIWESTLGPLFEGVLRTGEAFWAKDRLFVLGRNGFPEETFFDVSYDPVRDESGNVGGIFCIVTETTGRVVGERRLTTLRDLASRNAQARTPDDACAASTRAFEGNPHDVPFALFYLTSDKDQRPDFVCGTRETEALARSMAWPFDEVLSANAIRLISLDPESPALSSGPWEQPPTQAAVLPLTAAGQGTASGVLVLGINPLRPLDDDYRGFLELAASQVSAGIANAVAYEQEKARAEQLAGLDRAKTAFFSNVSHEFRTPLTLMLGPVDDALSDSQQPLPPAQRERLELVRRSGLRLQKLVNTLLDFSRIEAGRAQASYQATDLAGLTADLASSFRSAIERGGLRLTVECPPLDTAVFVDRDMWEKIVLNLLSNAFKYTFEGEIAVRLVRAGDRVELSVRDTGGGIPAAELPHIFERFRRVEGARSRTHEGTGIGLALVHELVKLHGGTVSAESTEGEGSTFTVAIPLGTSHLPQDRIDARRTLASTAMGAGPYIEEAMRWLPDAAPSPDTPPLGDAVPPPTSKPRRERIVWADDNADMREYVRRLLSPRYEVETVGDGEAALAAVRARRPDLVLADVMMPRLDGLGLARALRADPETRTIPLILLSARAGDQARIEGLDAGADDYLYKPFGARELLAHVAARMEQVRAREIIRRSEERYRKIFQMAGVSIWEEDFSDVKRALEELTDSGVADLPRYIHDHPEFVQRAIGLVKIRDVNQATLRLFGARSKSELMQSLHDVFVDETATVFRDELIALAEGRSTFEAEETVRTLQGERREVLINVAFPSPEAGYERVLVSLIDISDRKAAERERAQLIEQLSEADRRKDEFLATLSHELRNPMAPLRNSLHLLRLTKSPAAMGPIHEMMERQVDHLVRLVDDLLEVSRISRGTIELRREQVEIAAIVRNAVDTSDPLMVAAGHALSVNLPDTPLWVEGDPVRLAQILSNLLNNAAKYTEPGGRITLVVQSEGPNAVITVSDTGIGIPPDALPRMFQMFSRGVNPSAPGQGGLGIGLALARRLAEMHGGTITATSEGVGQGSVFEVRLPLSADQGTPHAEPRSETPIGPQRILVVDDNRDSADSLSMILQFLGADVRVARDGPEALAAFAAYNPAVVLLDIGMPGMDGYEVARRIRGAFPERTPLIVALTGWGQEADRRRADEAGFDHHLIKPADISVLRTLLATVRQG